MEDWEKKLREDLESVIGKPRQDISKHYRRKKSKGLTSILCVAVLAISSFNGWLIYSKSVSRPTYVVNDTKPIEVPTPTPPPVVPVPPSVDPAITAKLDRLEERVWVLGIVNNQNITTLKSNDEVNATDYVLLTKDWKLDKKPKYIIVSPEEKSSFDKIVAP